MKDSQTVSTIRLKSSDCAIDGLGYGFLAGLAMMTALIGFGLLQGYSPVEVLARFAPPLAARGAQSAGLAHLAVSAVYGAIFGLVWPQLAHRRLPGWLAGLVFGSLLLVVARFLQTAMLDEALDLPFLQLLVAHLLYGGSLGWLFGRSRFDK